MEENGLFALYIFYLVGNLRLKLLHFSMIFVNLANQAIRYGPIRSHVKEWRSGT